MDIVVIILVIAAVAVMIFKKFSSFVYYVAIVDIFLRLIAFLAAHLPISVIANFLATYFPNSVEGIIRAYSSGIFETVLLWLLFALYCIFEFYIVRIFFKKK